MAILIYALLGVTSMIAVQSGGVSASTGTGQAAITRGYYVSAATVLAQARLEQMKRLRYVLGPPAVDEIGAPIPSGFEDEAYGTIAGHPNFSRRVRVQSGTPGPNLKTVTVRVTFTLPTERAMQVESVVLGTIIAARP
jgi:hypothetical protein